jgi:hypothetical protein
MTRLIQALERAAETEKQDLRRNPGLTAAPRVDARAEIGVAVEAPRRSVRLPAVSETETLRGDSAATRTQIRGPRCDRAQRVPADAPGILDRILALMRIRFYRCDFCGCRFHRFNVESGDPGTDQDAVEISATFLPAADNRNFGELIRDIAHGEREQQSRHGLDSYAVLRKPRTQAGRESLNPPAAATSTKTDPSI